MDNSVTILLFLEALLTIFAIWYLNRKRITKLEPPKENDTKLCSDSENEFPKLYKKSFRMLYNGKWSDKCFATSNDDCASGLSYVPISLIHGVCADTSDMPPTCIAGTDYTRNNKCWKYFPQFQLENVLTK